VGFRGVLQRFPYLALDRAQDWPSFGQMQETALLTFYLQVIVPIDHSLRVHE